MTSILNTIDSLTKIFIVLESLDYMFDYNHYIEDLPMTYLEISGYDFYSSFSDAGAIDSYVNFHDTFADYSLSILISYNEDDFKDEDVVYNTIFLFYYNHTYWTAFYILMNILFIYFINFYLAESSSIIYVIYIQLLVYIYIYFIFFWNIDSYFFWHIRLVKLLIYASNFSCFFDFQYIHSTFKVESFNLGNIDETALIVFNYNDFFNLLVWDILKLSYRLDYEDGKYSFLLIYVFFFYLMTLAGRYWIVDPLEHINYQTTRNLDQRTKYWTKVLLIYEAHFLFKTIIMSYFVTVFYDFFIIYVFIDIVKFAIQLLIFIEDYELYSYFSWFLFYCYLYTVRNWFNIAWYILYFLIFYAIPWCRRFFFYDFKCLSHYYIFC